MGVVDDIYPGTKHNGASVCSLYLLEKMANKVNHSNMFAGPRVARNPNLDSDQERPSLTRP